MDQVKPDNSAQVVIPIFIVLPTCAFVVAFSGFLVKKLCDTLENNDEIPTIYHQSEDDSTDVDQPFSVRREDRGSDFVIDDVIDFDVHDHRRRVLEWSIASWTSVAGLKLQPETTLTKLNTSEVSYLNNDFAGQGPTHDIIKEKQHSHKKSLNKISSHKDGSTINFNDARLISNRSYISGGLRMRDPVSHYEKEFPLSPSDLTKRSPTEHNKTTLDAILDANNFSTENDIDSDITKREEVTRISSYAAVDSAVVHDNISSVHSDNTASDVRTNFGNGEDFYHNLFKNETEINNRKKINDENNRPFGANQEQSSPFIVHAGEEFAGTQNLTEIDKLPPGQQYVCTESVDRIYSSPTIRSNREITLNAQSPSNYASQSRGKFEEISSNLLPGRQTDKLLSTEMICLSSLVRSPSNKGQMNPRGLELHFKENDGGICDSKSIRNNEVHVAANSASNLRQDQLHGVSCVFTRKSLNCSSQKADVKCEVPRKSVGLGNSDNINKKATRSFNIDEQNHHMPKPHQINTETSGKDVHDYSKEDELRGGSETTLLTQRKEEEPNQPIISVTPRVSLGGKVFSVQIFSRKSPVAASIRQGAKIQSDFPELVIPVDHCSAKVDGSKRTEKSPEYCSVDRETPYFMFGNEIFRVKITETKLENLRNKTNDKQSRLRQPDSGTSEEECSVDYKNIFTPNIVIEAPESGKIRFVNPLVVLNGTVFKPFALPAKSNGRNQKCEENLPGVLVPVTHPKRSNLEGSYFLGHLDTFIPLLSLSGSLYRVLIPKYLLTEKQYSEFLSTPSILPGIIVPIRKGNLGVQIRPTIKRHSKTEKGRSSKRKLTAQEKEQRRQNVDYNGEGKLDGLGYNAEGSNKFELLRSSENHNYISCVTGDSQNFFSSMRNFEGAKPSKDNDNTNSGGNGGSRECQVNTKIKNVDSQKQTETKFKSEDNHSTHSFHPYHVILGNEIYKVRIFQPTVSEGNTSLLHGLLTSIASLKETKENLTKDSESLFTVTRQNIALGRSDEANVKLLYKSTVTDTGDSHISHYANDDVTGSESPSPNIPAYQENTNSLVRTPADRNTALLLTRLENAYKASQNQEKYLDWRESNSLNSSSDTSSQLSWEYSQVISPSKDEYRNILESECYEDLCSEKENCRRKPPKIVRVIPNKRRRGSLGRKWRLQSLESIEEEEYVGDENKVLSHSHKDEISTEICESCPARSKQSREQPVIRSSHEPQGTSCSLTYIGNCFAASDSERLSTEYNIFSEQENNFKLNNTSEKVEGEQDKTSLCDCVQLKSLTKTENSTVTYYLPNTHERMTIAVSNGTINNTDRQDVQSPQCSTTVYGLKPYRTTRDVCAASINEGSCCTSLCEGIKSQSAVSWRKEKGVCISKECDTLVEGNISQDLVAGGTNISYIEEGVTVSNTTDSVNVSSDTLGYEIHDSLGGCCDRKNIRHAFDARDENVQTHLVEEVHETERENVSELLPVDFIIWNKNTIRFNEGTTHSELINMDSAKRQKSKKKEKTLEVPVSDPSQLRYAKIGKKKVVIVRDPKVMEAEQLRAQKKALKRKKPEGRRIVLAGGDPVDDDRISVRSLPAHMSTHSMRSMRRPTPRPGSPSSLPDAVLVRDHSHRSLPPNLRTRGRPDIGMHRSREEIYPRERSNTGPSGHPRKSMSLPDHSNYQQNVLVVDRPDGSVRYNKQIYDVPHINNTTLRQPKRVPGRGQMNTQGPDERHTYSLPRTKGHDSKYGTFAERGAHSGYNVNQTRNSGSLPPRLPVRQAQDGTLNRNAPEKYAVMNGSLGRNHPSNYKHPSRSSGNNPEEYERHHRRLHMAQAKPTDPRNKNFSGSTENFHPKPEAGMRQKAASLHDVARLNADRPPKPIETNVIINSGNELQARPSRTDHSERGSSDENSVFTPSVVEGAVTESGVGNQMNTSSANAKVKVETCFYWEPGFETKLEKERKKEREEILETEFTGAFTRGSIESGSIRAADRQSFRIMQNKDLRALSKMQEKGMNSRQNMQSVPKDQNRQVTTDKKKLPPSEKEHIKMPSKQENIYAQPRVRNANDMSIERPKQGKIEGKIQNTENAVYSNNRLGYHSDKSARSISPKHDISEDVPHASVKETTFGVPSPIESAPLSSNKRFPGNSSAEHFGKHHKMETTFGGTSVLPHEKPRQKETSFYESHSRDENVGNNFRHNESIASNPKQKSAKGITKWQLPGLAVVNGSSNQEQRGSSIGTRKETSLSEPLRKETVLDGSNSNLGTATYKSPVIEINRSQTRPERPTLATQTKIAQGHKNMPQRRETSLSSSEKTNMTSDENGLLSGQNYMKPPIRNVGNRPPYSSKPVVTSQLPNQQFPKRAVALQRKETSRIEPDRSGMKDGHYSQRLDHQPTTVNGTQGPRIKPKNMETSFSSSQGQNTSISKSPLDKKREKSNTRDGLQSATVLTLSSDGEPSEDTDSDPESFAIKAQNESDEDRNTIKPSRFGAVRDSMAEEESKSPPTLSQNSENDHDSSTEPEILIENILPEEDEYGLPDPEETFWPNPIGADSESKKQTPKPAPKPIPKPAPKPRPRDIPMEKVTKANNTFVERHEKPKIEPRQNNPREVAAKNQGQNIPIEDKHRKNNVDKVQSSSDLDKSAPVSRKPFSTAFCLRGVKIQKTVIPLPKSTKVDENSGNGGLLVNSQSVESEMELLPNQEIPETEKFQPTDEGHLTRSHQDEQQLISPLSISGSSVTTITEPDSDKEDESLETRKMEVPTTLELPGLDDKERRRFESGTESKLDRPIPSPRAPLSIKPVEEDPAFGFNQFDIPTDLPPPPEYSDTGRENNNSHDTETEQIPYKPTFSSGSAERSLLHVDIHQQDVGNSQEMFAPEEQPVTFSYKPSYSEADGPREKVKISRNDYVENEPNRYLPESSSTDRLVSENEKVVRNSFHSSNTDSDISWGGSTIHEPQSRQWEKDHFDVGGDNRNDDNTFLQNGDARWFPEPDKEPSSDQFSEYHNPGHDNQDWDQEYSYVGNEEAQNNYELYDEEPRGAARYYYSPAEAEVEYESNPSKGAKMYYPAEMADEDFADGDVAYSDSLRSSSMGLASYMHFEDLQGGDNREMQGRAGTMYIPDFGEDYDDDYDDDVEVGDTALHFYPEHDMEPIFQRLETIPEEMEPWSDETSEYSEDEVSSTEEGDVTVDDRTIDTFPSIAPVPGDVERVFLPDAMAAEVGSGVDSESLCSSAAATLHHAEDAGESMEPQSHDRNTNRSGGDNEPLRDSYNTTVAENEREKKATDPDYLFPITDDVKVPPPEMLAGSITEETLLSREKIKEDNESDNDAFIMEDESYIGESHSEADEELEVNPHLGNTYKEQFAEGMQAPPSRSFVIALVAQNSVVQRDNTTPTSESPQDVPSSPYANENNFKAPPPLAEEDDFSQPEEEGINQPDENTPVSYSSVHESPVRIVSPLKVNTRVDEEVIKTAEVIDQSTPNMKKFEEVAVKEKIPKQETDLKVKYSPVPVKVIYSTTATPQKIEYPSKVASTDLNLDIKRADQKAFQSFSKIEPIQPSERSPTFVQVEHREAQRKPQKNSVETMHLPARIQGEGDVPQTNIHQPVAESDDPVVNEKVTKVNTKVKVTPIQPTNVTQVSHQPPLNRSPSGPERELPVDEPKRDGDEPKIVAESPPKSKDRSGKRKFRKIQGNHRAAIQDVIADLETNLGVEISAESKQSNDTSRATVELDKQRDIDKSVEDSIVQSNEIEEQRAPKPKYSKDSVNQRVKPLDSQQPAKVVDVEGTIQEPVKASSFTNLHHNESRQNAEVEALNQNFDSIPKQGLPSSSPSNQTGKSKEKGGRISAKPCPKFDLSGLNVEIPNYDNIFSQVKAQHQTPKPTLQSFKANGLDVAPVIHPDPPGELLRTESGEIDKQLERMRENLKRMTLPDWFRKSYQYEKLMTGDVRSLPSYWSYKAPRRLVASSPSTPTGLRKQFMTITTQLPFLTAASFRWKDTQDDGRVSPANSLPDSWTFPGLSVQTYGLSPNNSATPSPNPNRSSDLNESVEASENLNSSPQVFNYSPTPQSEDRFSAKSLFTVEPTPLLTTTQVVTNSRYVQGPPEPNKEVMEHTNMETNDRVPTSPPQTHAVRPSGRSSGGSAVFCITSSMLVNSYQYMMPSNSAIDSSDNYNNNNDDVSNSLFVSEHTDGTVSGDNYREAELDIPESGGDLSSSDEVFAQETMPYYNPSSNWVGQDFDQQQYYDYQMGGQDDMQYYSMQI